MKGFRPRANLCVGAILLALSAHAARAESKIVIGYIPSGDFLPAFVASDKGFFKDAGLDAQLVAVPLATNVPAAEVSGSVQIGMTTTPIMFQARENGIDLVAISGLSWDLRKNPQLSLLVRKGSGIKSAKDLVGKKIAFPGLKSLFDSATTYWLTKKGVDPKQVTYVEGQMPQLVDLLKSGNVDAIAVLDPFRAKAISEGIARNLSNFLVELKNNQPLAYWMSTRAYAASHPSVIKGFREALAKSLVFIKQHPNQARKLGAKYLHGNILAHFPNWSLSITAADMKFETDMEHSVGVLRRKPNLATAILK